MLSCIQITLHAFLRSRSKEGIRVVETTDYEIPIRVGMVLKDQRSPVSKIGVPLLNPSSPAAIVPVQLADGTYRIAWCNGDSITSYLDHEGIVAQSKQMPIVERGIGSGVFHISGQDVAGVFLLKVYYNEKADRSPEVHRPSQA